MDKPFPAYRGDGPYVFICYAHADSATVYEHLAWMNDHGVNVWYDEGIAGGEIWRAELATAIERASTFIYFISPASVRSAHCLREIHYALDNEIKIIPIYVEETELPPDLRIGLSNVQALKLEDRDFETHLLRALESPPAQRSRPDRRPASRRRLQWPAVLTIAAVAILGVTVWWLARQSSESGPPLTSIAVMPFDDRSPEGGEAWLGSALAETLTEYLGRIESLRIPGATSTASLKRRDATVREVGDSLDVGAVIEGTVQRAGDALQISVRWVRVVDEAILWSAVYPTKLDDIFETQRTVASDVAEVIRTTLDVDVGYEFFAEQRYAPTDVRAWKAVRDAINLVVTPSAGPPGEHLRKAAGLARQAIELDPSFAEAHAALALIAEASGARETAAAAKRRALELDPKNIAAHATFMNYNIARWDFATATQQLERAKEGISHSNSQISSMRNFQRVLWITGRKAEALEYAKSAVEHEPQIFLAQYNLGLSHLVLDEPDFAGAISPLEHAVSLGGTSAFANIAHFFLAIAYAHVGRETDALDAYLASRDNGVLSVQQRDTFLEAFETAGWPGLIRAALDDAERSGDSCPPFAGHALVGDRDAMYRCLERSWQGSDEDWPRRGWAPLFNLLLTPAYAPYRNEPRFRAIVDRVRSRIERAAGTGDAFGGVPPQPPIRMPTDPNNGYGTSKKI